MLLPCFKGLLIISILFLEQGTESTVANSESLGQIEPTTDETETIEKLTSVDEFRVIAAARDFLTRVDSNRFNMKYYPISTARGVKQGDIAIVVMLPDQDSEYLWKNRDYANFIRVTVRISDLVVLKYSGGIDYKKME